jgi:hypothetical protein
MKKPTDFSVGFFIQTYLRAALAAWLAILSIEARMLAGRQAKLIRTNWP